MPGIGGYDLYTGSIMRPPHATVVVDVVDEDLGRRLLVAAVKSTKSAMEA